ncbi:hypothetical protein ASO20_02260 [Mycoplasma sp. (ex Biomphalaria glabrata)]|uniref:tRNA uracil 4-sulfurtransferase ThiI n=1 Tax=Mycoplasma sp. (ex Biomphalaria glabrata) TaxID=1749074 RepID=UPI00073A7CEE|nr:tRNA uracil 4-sulfurtransferase ThiI [Mycoplasma sp. (ex Biomphalaria glabrata)]ALV23460.1 hypothetical protein ASO20_02260 [Mycoplasma sp. (ex Biomphalaria glabrata)]
MNLKYNFVIIRFGELYLKGANKKYFVNKLFSNLNKKLKPIGVKPILEKDRIVIELEQNIDARINDILIKTPGISNFSFGWKITREWDDLVNLAAQVIKQHNQPYYIECERKDKRYQKSSLEIKQYLAHDIEKKTGIVGSFDCDFALSVIVYENFFFLCENKRKGVGGLPVGTSGRALILISGGIDSPVAAYELMKRGMEVEYVHFITPPQTSDLALRKVKDLISKLNDFAPNPQKLYIVDFAKMQHEIMCSAKEEYRIVLMRRMFYRLAEAIANNNKIQAIATGESLGQVASQTIENLQSVDSVIDMIVIRPLITFDKVQTIEIAQRIGTYDISIRPYEDCCTLFVPKNPVIKSKTYIAKHEEEKMLMLEILKTIMDSEITEEITN